MPRVNLSCISAALFFIGTLLFCLQGVVVPSVEAADTKILFLGDSITAGLGLENEQAYPFLVEAILRKRGARPITIINGSISGSTTASALSRLQWYQRMDPDIVVLALGANDGLRGLSTQKMEENLEKAIVFSKEKGITVVLAGMEVPPNYGSDYSKAFRTVFKTLADRHNLIFIPFLLTGVAGDPALNQPDGIHPNPAGQKIIAETVAAYLLECL